MSAIGELFVYAVYFILGLTALFFLVLTFFSRKSIKPWTVAASLFFGFLFFSFNYFQDENYKKEQLGEVGIYYLTSYPNCDSCYVELKENMRYAVVNKDKIVEQGDWHHEVGGDYSITYLDNDGDQLGSDQYRYERYELKYSQDLELK